MPLFILSLFSKQELSMGKVLFSCLRLPLFKILKRILNSAEITTFLSNSQVFSHSRTGRMHKTKNTGNYMMCVFFCPPLTHLLFFCWIFLFPTLHSLLRSHPAQTLWTEPYSVKHAWNLEAHFGTRKRENNWLTKNCICFSSSPASWWHAIGVTDGSFLTRWLQCWGCQW